LRSSLPIIPVAGCAGPPSFRTQFGALRTAKGDEPVINPLSTNAAPGITPKAEAELLKERTDVKAAKLPNRSEATPAKLETPIKDSVQLSPSAQARALRQAGQSIPQIALKLGLAIPTVAAFFEE